MIQDTVKEELPKDFQTAEKQLEMGFVDKIVDRKDPVVWDILENVVLQKSPSIGIFRNDSLVK